MATRTVDELLGELVADPSDGAYLVYADAATEAGDPRGELIMVQRALAAGAGDHESLVVRERELLRDDRLWGALADRFDSGRERAAVQWRNGFVHRLRLADSRLRDTHTLDWSLDIDLVIGELIAHPSLAMLEELVLASSKHDFGSNEIAVLADRGMPRLRRLVLNDQWERTSDSEPPAMYDNSWFRVDGLGAVAVAAPQLETLELIAGDFPDFAQLDLPRLRTLALRTGGLRPERLVELLARPQPALTRLELWFGSPQYGGTIDVAELATLLSGAHLPQLRWLGLMNSEFTNELIDPLADSPLLARLDGLSLSLGCLASHGARRIRDRWPAFAHLREIDLSFNLLDREAGEAFAGDPHVNLANQRGDRFFRYATVSE